MIPIELHKRKPLTKRQLVELFHRDNGLCCICGGRIGASDRWEDFDRSTVIDEHKIPLGLAGSNDLKNRGLAHVKCAAIKTKSDMTNIAKAKRREAKHLGVKRSRNPMPGSRASKFKVKFNGKIELR